MPLHHSSTSLEFDGAEKGAAGEKKKRPQQGRTTSWDLLGERAEWEDYNPAKASVENLRFAEGDVGTNPVCSACQASPPSQVLILQFSKFYYWCLNRSIIFRWALYIVPVLALLWIPGIVQESAAPNAQVWGVPLVSFRPLSMPLEHGLMAVVVVHLAHSLLAGLLGVLGGLLDLPFVLP